jgi:adenylate cyclase
MQALNRLDGQPFGDDDAARMSAFGAQAAIAIDNARLFGEVVAARNFDESILSSMAAGVIALDAEWTITKLNAAAADILGAPASLLEGMDARDLIRRHNPWLVDEIAAVVASGEPKSLLDVDLATARERPASVNVSIVPLRGKPTVDGEDADETPQQSGIVLLIEDISEEKRLQGTMRRFMSQSVVDQVLGREDDLMFGTACTASVLFADIRGFTTMAEQLTPRETVETLNGLFAELFEAVAAHDGVLDKFIGDAIMAVFGAPLPSGRDPANAVAAALEMLRMTGEISAARAAAGQPPVRLGVGIATGEVVAGTIGSPKRMDYTVIGDSVNLASRLQDLTKTYGVELLVDAATASALDGGAALREIDRIRVKGRERPETIFEVCDAAFAVNGRAALLDAYGRGRAALGERRWADAVRAFEEAARIDPADRPSGLMLERARALAAEPAAADWDGVWRHTAKA